MKTYKCIIVEEDLEKGKEPVPVGVIFFQKRLFQNLFVIIEEMNKIAKEKKAIVFDVKRID